MKKKIGVLLIRGAGKADSSNDQEKFIKKLQNKLFDIGVNPDDVYFELANWYGPTQVNQDILLSKFFSSEYKIRSKWPRQFVINLISDIVAYIGEPNKISTTYQHTHEMVYLTLKNIEAAVEPNAPLVIIASSLGTEIISNYINDRQNATDPDPLGVTPFQKMETLTGIFMFGNNNPLYISAYDIETIKPFQFPPDNLHPKYNGKTYWGNFYDKNDPLGFPLKPINLHYNSMVTEDVQINVGGLLAFWNPLSHLRYWSCRKIIKKIADYLKLILSI